MAIELVKFNQNFLNEVEQLLAEIEKLLLFVDLECRNTKRLSSSEFIDHSNKADEVMCSYARMAEITHILEKLLSDIHSSDLTFNSYIDSLAEATDELKVAVEIQFKSSGLLNEFKK